MAMKLHDFESFWGESGNECRCERTGDTLPRLLSYNLYVQMSLELTSLKKLTSLKYNKHRQNRTICPNYSFEMFLFPVSLNMYYKNNF